jgi:MSHA biogenesis protein MshI
MSQEINLLDPVLRPKPELFTLLHVMQAMAVVLALVVLSGAWSEWRLATARRQSAAVEAELYSAQTRLAELATARARHLPSPEIEQKIREKTRLLADKTEVLRLLESGAIGKTEGFSAYMLALARQVPDGLWLTGFDIQSNLGAPHIEGNMQSESLLPRFIQRLNQEPVFAGGTFAAVRIEEYRPKTVPGASAAGLPAPAVAADKTAAVPATRFWTFILGPETDGKAGKP